MSQPVIDVQGLCKRFGTLDAVRDVSFSVRAGTTTGLLGGNGAGKTTTLSMLIGLLTPSAGSIHVLGADMRQHRYEALPYVNFASPYVDLPRRLTVGDNLRVFAHLYGVKGVNQRLTQLGRDLEIASFLKRPYGELSAGQRTRVSLAKALINEPRLLLMDEPTASLDPDMADYVRSYLQAYQRRTGATMLLASHNMQEVERICDDVVMMRQGQVVDHGAPRALLAKYGRQSLEDVFLEIARQGRGTHQAPEVAAS